MEDVHISQLMCMSLHKGVDDLHGITNVSAVFSVTPWSIYFGNVYAEYKPYSAGLGSLGIGLPQRPFRSPTTAFPLGLKTEEQHETSSFVGVVGPGTAHRSPG